LETNSTDLSVRSESVQSLYSRYLADRFGVNRRYQRKLVWSVEEKQSLIDSMLQNLPVPLFLVAEIGIGAEASFEVIDGMQRLNSIFAFIENEFAVDGTFFDLDALADTKSRKDRGDLVQHTPIMSRDESVRLSNYTVALSIFRATSESSVDEVFRRINSGGRRLSFQELRQAGTLSPLADLVRVISSRVRGDTSPTDVVPLRVMPQLSITSRDLSYGVQVDEIFWVRHGILRREDVRTSLDEQLVLDILIDCVIDPIPTIGKDVRDDFYDFTAAMLNDSSSMQITAAIDAYGREELERDFMRVYDVVRILLDTSDQARFATLIGVKSGGRSPRYFHGVFIAIFELMFRERMRAKDDRDVATRLVNISKTALNIPGGSGNWTSESKRSAIDAVKGVLRSAFEEGGGDEDFARYGWASELETILGNALVEQQAFECKQGLLRLDERRSVDEALLSRLGETLTAIANIGRGATGYLLLGVADKRADATRIQALDGVESARYRDFYIPGLDREARLRASDLGGYWKWLLQKLRDNPDMHPELASQVASAARLANYKGRSVGVLKVRALKEPVFYGGRLYERSGSETLEVPPGSGYSRIFGQFVG